MRAETRMRHRWRAVASRHPVRIVHSAIILPAGCELLAGCTAEAAAERILFRIGFRFPSSADRCSFRRGIDRAYRKEFAFVGRVLPDMHDSRPTAPIRAQLPSFMPDFLF